MESIREVLRDRNILPVRIVKLDTGLIVEHYKNGKINVL